MHHAVLKCIPGKVQFLINKSKEIQGASDDDIKRWINSVTTQD